MKKAEHESAFHEKFMKRAISLAISNLSQGGGPFGAVIVKDGKVIGEGVNRVTSGNDPTAHAEIEAIRNAAQALGDFSLSGCTIYASCEPCPMCLGAIYWSRLEAVCYSSDRYEAESAGFDDSLIYNEFSKPADERMLKQVQLLPEQGAEVFRKWNVLEDKTPY